MPRASSVHKVTAISFTHGAVGAALFAALTLLSASAPASAETGRLFFDLAGNGGDENAPHPGGLALENPALPPGGGRLYLYWEFGRPSGQGQNVLGLNFGVAVDGGVVTEAMNYNPTNASFGRRWQHASPNPAANPNAPSQRFTTVNIGAFGLLNDLQHVQNDPGYDPPTNSTILGYVDVAAPSTGSVWITVDTLGIAIAGGSPRDDIYMGFGDGPVPAGGSPGRRTDVPEATIVPEPAALLLFATGAAALIRRRHDKRQQEGKGTRK